MRQTLMDILTWLNQKTNITVKLIAITAIGAYLYGRCSNVNVSMETSQSIHVPSTHVPSTDGRSRSILRSIGSKLIRTAESRTESTIRDEAIRVVSGDGKVSDPARGIPSAASSSGRVETLHNGLSHNLGIQAGFPSQAGIDLRFYRHNNWGAQIGAAYFKEEKKIGETLTGSYNIHKWTHDWTTNLWLYGGGSFSRKTLVAGIRIDL